MTATTVKLAVAPSGTTPGIAPETGSPKPIVPALAAIGGEAGLPAISSPRPINAHTIPGAPPSATAPVSTPSPSRALRTENELLSIKILNDILQLRYYLKTQLEMSRESGYLPKWVVVRAQKGLEDSKKTIETCRKDLVALQADGIPVPRFSGHEEVSKELDVLAGQCAELGTFLAAKALEKGPSLVRMPNGVRIRPPQS